MGKEATTKSPLKDPPLRVPGQSVGEEIDRVLDVEMMPYFLASMVSVMLAVLEWRRYYHDVPPSPRVVTAIAVVVVGYSVIRILGGKSKLRRLRQGMDGERVVGQALEDLRQAGAMVFHDVCAKNFNVDHVVVSPEGIFAIETKTYSKRNGRGVTVRYDGVKLLVDGSAPEGDPIKQVRANAQWVHELVKESTGNSFPVRPVVLFPGWYVETVNASAHDKVWVLNPKCLLSFIEHSKEDLVQEDVRLVSYHLSRYVRSRG